MTRLAWPVCWTACWRRVRTSRSRSCWTVIPPLPSPSTTRTAWPGCWTACGGSARPSKRPSRPFGCQRPAYSSFTRTTAAGRTGSAASPVAAPPRPGAGRPRLTGITGPGHPKGGRRGFAHHAGNRPGQGASRLAAAPPPMHPARPVRLGMKAVPHDGPVTAFRPSGAGEVLIQLTTDRLACQMRACVAHHGCRDHWCADPCTGVPSRRPGRIRTRTARPAAAATASRAGSHLVNGRANPGADRRECLGLFNKSLRHAVPACRRESARAAECQFSTPRTTVR